MRPSVKCGVIAILVTWFSTTALGVQLERQVRGSLFGVRLNGKASSLLAEVEQLYGKQIRQEWLAADHPMSGNSKVADDGTPIIYINPSHGRKLDVIVHELYHFKLRSRGYPVVLWLFPRYMDTEANRSAFEQLRQQLYDPILHYVFYPEVRASFGINPGETFEQRTRKALDDKSLARTFATMDRGAVALYYFKIRLELADTELQRRLLSLLERETGPEGVQFGEQLVRIVRQAKPESPTDAINVLVACLNVFYDRQFRFEQHPWRSRQLGQHTQKVVPIELKPVQ